MRQLLLMSPLFVLLIGAWRLQSTALNEELPGAQKIVDLSGRSLKEIPDEYKDRVLDAEILILDNNFIIGLPEWFKDCNQLKKISFNNNPEFDLFQFTVDFQEMNWVEEISASNCNILSIPYQLTFFTRLKNLDLSNNLIGEVPYHFSFITTLEECNFSGNYIKEVGFVFRDLNRLKSLDLSGNKKLNLKDFCLSLENKNFDYLNIDVRDTIPEQLSSITCEELVLGVKDETFFNGQIAALNCNQLTIGNNDAGLFDKSLIGELSLNRNIKELILQGFEINTFPLEISKINSLKSLDISGSELASIKNLTSMNYLNNLNVSENLLSLDQIEELKTSLPQCRISSDEEQLRGNQVSFSINAPISNIEIPSQSVIIDPKKSKQIYSVSGQTKFDIPANAFLDEKGSIVTGPVEISLTEYNDAVDIALSGIPMQIKNADGSAGNFSSAGMFDFRASANGKEVFPNPKALITASISSKQKTPYNLYEFKDGVGWNLMQPYPVIPAPPAQSESVASIDPNNFNNYSVYEELARLKVRMADTAILNRLSIYEPKILMKHKRNNRNKTFELSFDVLNMYEDLDNPFKYFYYEFPGDYIKMLNRKLVYNDYNFIKDIALMDSIKRDIKKTYYSRRNHRKIRKRKGKYEFKWEENILVKDIAIKPDRKRDDYVLSFNYRGKPHSFHVILPESYNEAKNVQEQYEKYYQNFLYASGKKDAERKKVLEKYEKYYDKLEETKREEYKRLKKEFDEKLALAEEQMKNSGMSFAQYEEQKQREGGMVYTFQLASFGVTNCDVVTRMQRPGKVKGVFKTILGGTLMYLKMIRIDKKMNMISTIMPGDNVTIDYSHEQTALLLILEDGMIGLVDAQTLATRRNDNEINVKVIPEKELKPEKVRAML